MGSCSFKNTVIASSASAAFRKLQREAIREYGEDCYNGTISTCEIGRCVASFPAYKASNEKKAEAIIQKTTGCKRVADFIDLGVVSRHVAEVRFEKSEKREKPKFARVFTVERHGFFGDGERDTDESFATMTEAKAFAQKLVLEHGEGFLTTIRSDFRAVKGDTRLAEVKLNRRSVTRRPKSLKPNQRYTEEHKYVFFGWAAY